MIDAQASEEGLHFAHIVDCDGPYVVVVLKVGASCIKALVVIHRADATPRQGRAQPAPAAVELVPIIWRTFARSSAVSASHVPEAAPRSIRS